MEQLIRYQSGAGGGALDTLLAANTLDLSKISKKSHLVFSEHVWGIKDKENFIFDPEKYAILDFMKEGVNDEILSDTVINYYSDGKREVVPAAKVLFFANKKLYWDKKHHYDSQDGYWADMDKMLTLFSRDAYLKRLNEKYPYLRYNARFHINADLESYELAMPLQNAKSYVSINFNEIVKYNEFSSLGRLQKFFKTFVQVLDNENTDKWMEAKGITANIGPYAYAKCKVYAGYPDLTYRVAEMILSRAGKDTKKLKKVFLESGEPLNLTYGLTAIPGKDCNRFDWYDAKAGCPTKGDFMFSPKVFANWGADFTPAELSVITRERFFNYWNPDIPKNTQEKALKSTMKKSGMLNQIKKYITLWDL